MSSIDDLVAEAQRQLTICNACRYCEGYCAVFPALERRTVLEGGDITQLANLCHDCRACLYACMYAAPHEFAINPPAALSAVRLASYDRLVPRPAIPTRLLGGRGPVLATILAVVVIGLVAILSEGAGALWKHGTGAASPYSVVAYPVLLAVVLLSLAFSVVVAIRAAGRYWKDVGGRWSDLRDLGALAKAARYAATLRYQRGGGDECYYPEGDPSSARRRFHGAVMWGFLACLGSTLSAGVLQDLLGSNPPYDYLSVPVGLGLAGGLAMVIGCAGLISLKMRSDPAAADPQMAVRDMGLLVALEVLSLTGLLTLFTRTTAVFPLVLVVHLASVVVAFAVFPYTKFMHWVYRYLAIVRDNQERATTAA